MVLVKFPVKHVVKIERDGKQPKVDGVEVEAQLELKITAKAGSRLKTWKRFVWPTVAAKVVQSDASSTTSNFILHFRLHTEK